MSDMRDTDILVSGVVVTSHLSPETGIPFEPASWVVHVAWWLA
jgi:hypothetical protein